MEDNAPHLHINTLLHAAVVMDVVGKIVANQHLPLVVFKVFLELNGNILMNLVTFKPSSRSVCIDN